MLLFYLLHVSVEFLYVSLRSPFPLHRICHPVKIQFWHLRASVYAYCIISGSGGSRILDIKRASRFRCHRRQLRNRNGISPYFERSLNCLSHRSRLCMILGRYKLQIRGFSRFLAAMADINRNLFSRCGGNSQRLPCVQTSESPAYVAGRNITVNLNRLRQFGSQNLFRCLKFPF